MGDCLGTPATDSMGLEIKAAQRGVNSVESMPPPPSSGNESDELQI